MVVTTISVSSDTFSQVARGEPVHSLPHLQARLLRHPSTRSLGWSEEKLCTTSDAATNLTLSLQQKTLLAAMRTCSDFSRV